MLFSPNNQEKEALVITVNHIQRTIYHFSHWAFIILMMIRFRWKTYCTGWFHTCRPLPPLAETNRELATTRQSKYSLSFLLSFCKSWPSSSEVFLLRKVTTCHDVSLSAIHYFCRHARGGLGFLFSFLSKLDERASCLTQFALTCLYWIKLQTYFAIMPMAPSTLNVILHWREEGCIGNYARGGVISNTSLLSSV